MDLKPDLDSQINKDETRLSAMAADDVLQGGGLVAVAAGPEINLEIPKSTKEPVDSAVKESSHICNECGKGFSSGKALGGHISSAHVQAKDRLKTKRSHLDGDYEEEKHICWICLREFHSSRSLYGHMRFHRERHWQGKELRDHQHRAQYDLTALVGSGWGKTGRRSQKFEVPIFDSTDFANEEEKEMTDQAAREMVRLAHGAPVTDDVDLVNPEVFRVPCAGLPEWSGAERAGGASSDAIKVSTAQISTTLHTCEVCGKSFTTGQALGGHKRCHYVGALSSAAKSPSPQDEIGGERSERNVPEFDLNVPSSEDGCDI